MPRTPVAPPQSLLALALPRVLLALVFFSAILGAHAARAAEPLSPKDVPAPLKPWTGWVLDGKEASLCPTLQVSGDVQRCAWPSRLELAVGERGGRFSQTWHLDAKEWVLLPGSADRWPSDVQVDGKRAVLVPSGTGNAVTPSVLLEHGDHRVTGSFTWDSPPDSLHIPEETGLLALTLRGVPIASPNRDAGGTVWLQKASTNEEGDALELVIHRKVTDDIPLLLTTRIELHVAGKSREELLGKALPAGFVPLSLSGDLPARLEPDGRVRVQVRPGVFALELAARSEGAVSAITRGAPEGPWREGDEVWVFDARNDYRIVSVEGAPSIDPQQTTLVDAWKRLPAYAMKVGDTLRLVERRRGDADPPPNQLDLERSLWLDFDGKGFTASDTITGSLTRDSRLTMAAPTVLGRVAIGGKDQFITRLADVSGTGVEVRQGTLNVSADSRIVGDPSDIPAVSWAHDFHQVTGKLHLPPGWRLFHASGVDDVSGTWVRHWSLLELFLALVIALGIGKLYGPRWGVIALVTLALTFPEEDAPKWSWIVLLAVEALFRALPVGKVKSFFGGMRGAAAILVALITIPFLVQHVRQGMYPALASTDAVFASGASPGFGGEEMRADQEAPGLAKELVAAAGGDARPSAPPAAVGAASDAVEGKAGRKLLNGLEVPTRQAPSPKIAPYRGSIALQSNAEVYDPAAIVQTGPGLPRWPWPWIALRWSGPVTAAQHVHLYLLSPGVNLVLAFLRAALLVLLLARLLPWTGRFLPRGLGPAAAVITAFAVMLSPAAARADTPSDAMLAELQARLLRKPECLPSCASSGKMTLYAAGDTLRVWLDVDAAALTAVPLPGRMAQWSPAHVLLDGQPAKGLARISDGTLWIELAPGAHEIALDGPLPDGASMQLALPLKPHRVIAMSGDWAVAGIHEDGLADDNLQLTRAEPRSADAGAGAALQPGELPPFVRVERTLRVGLNWQVETHVVRGSPPGAAIVLEVPLLPGESVTTADVRVVGGKAQVNLAPQVSDVSWRSVLEQKSPVKLVAPRSVPWSEVWRVDVGPVWHATYAGIPFVHTAPVNGLRVPEWRPWPGEEASVALVRPDGVPGQTLTIDESSCDVTPGLRATDVTLSLMLRASRGSQHTVVLPPSSQLESLAIDGAPQPIRQDGRNVTVPIVPGPQKVVLVWRQTPGIGPFFDVPAIDLGAPSVNASVAIHVPGARWLLFAGGPRVGPAVLFWSLFLVLLVVAWALGRNEWTPLRTWQWFLLGIGLSQVDLLAGAAVVGWLLALGWRGREAGDGWRVTTFNLRQIVLVLWSCASLVLLFMAVDQGLLGAPAMQVRGNASNGDTLRWFVDRCDGPLPVPWMLSVPLLVYRAAMLAWALWLALALLGWLRWGWRAFSTGGLWRKRPRRAAPIPPVAPSAPLFPAEPGVVPQEGGDLPRTP